MDSIENMISYMSPAGLMIKIWEFSNEIYLLGDFNIVLQNGNYILNRKGGAACQGWVHTLINKYQEFCQLFSLKQLITWPSHVTCNTSFLIDHIPTNSAEKIFQSGIIYCGMSDHQLIFCTKKVKQAKFNKQCVSKIS